MSNGKEASSAIKKRAIKAVRILFAILVGAFILKLLVSNWSAVRNQVSDLDYLILAESTLVFAFGYVLWGFLWHSLMHALGERPTLRQAMCIWSYSQATRYLPGMGWQVAGRVYLSHKDGLSKKVSGVSLILEHVFLLCSSVAVAGISLTTGLKNAGLPWVGLVFILLAGALLIIQPNIFSRLLDKALVRFGRDPINIQLSSWVLLKFVALYAGVWVVQSIAFVLCLKSFGGITVPPLTAIGVFTISWTVGFLFVIAPSGLGVREFTIASMLRTWCAFGVGMAAAIVARLVMVVGELLVLIGAFVWEKLEGKADTLNPELQKPQQNT